MKVTDYIVEFLLSKRIDHVFGYPGGVICHLMDSIEKYSPRIQGHINYHEQASSLAACGYAQISLRPGVAFATSGPGATNLITGIANAYFDSIPTIFITGQVDTYASRGSLAIRQRGFQETDIVSIVTNITKYAVRIDAPEKVQACLEEAYQNAVTGRPGPVLLDIPADIQRAEISTEGNAGSEPVPIVEGPSLESLTGKILGLLKLARRPCLLLGAGIKQSGLIAEIRQFAEYLRIPVVTSMLAFDVLPDGHPLNFGFIGANGHRYANFIVAKCDLLLCLGSRLDLKQVGNNRSLFAPQAKIIRVEIDEGELTYPVRSDEIPVVADLTILVPALLRSVKEESLSWESWLNISKEIRNKLEGLDDRDYHKKIAQLSTKIPDGLVVTVDVGQHEPWVAHSFKAKGEQRFCFSGGLGTMGYSLPASIGAYYATLNPVVSINGDGGIQMNIQELQFLAREDLPILVVILNNHSLGMIRHFQEMNFSAKYISTTLESGYSPPNFEKIARAFGLDYLKATSVAEIACLPTWNNKPCILEIELDNETYLEPKFSSGRPNQDQEPLLERKLYDELMGL